MKIRKMYIVLSVMAVIFLLQPRRLNADVCRVKVKCVTGGEACLYRGPCEPINKFLLDAAKRCKKEEALQHAPISRLLFVDILRGVLRLDKELPQDIDTMEDAGRYKLIAKVLAEKGINIFTEKDPTGPLTRNELAGVLKNVKIEEDLGYSSGLPDQIFSLSNDGYLIYDTEVYVDEGEGFKIWQRQEDFEKSSPISRHYSVRVDTCGNAMVVFGDNDKGKIPLVGAKIKASYKIFGKEKEVVTLCEVVSLLSDHKLARAIKETYNPSRPLTRVNFANLLIRTMHLEKQLPPDVRHLTARELYLIEARILSRNGINIYTEKDPEGLLTREELARILYNYPVVELVGVSDGKGRQRFELNNSGFMIYDIHVFVNEGASYEEWNKKDDFTQSSSGSKDYVVKFDAGNYANIYFGDGRQGKIPSINSPVKVTYRLYAPLDMLTEDDVACILGKLKPVVETYIPPAPPPEFPPPTDGFEDPATHT